MKNFAITTLAVVTLTILVSESTQAQTGYGGNYLGLNTRLHATPYSGYVLPTSYSTYGSSYVNSSCPNGRCSLGRCHTGPCVNGRCGTGYNFGSQFGTYPSNRPYHFPTRMSPTYRPVNQYYTTPYRGGVVGPFYDSY